jgi:putative FmdB family regulatory protein
MPTYQYECDNPECKHTFEHMQGMTTAKLKNCPKCKKDTLVRLIGKGSGIIFKGPGFYATDYPKE